MTRLPAPLVAALLLLAACGGGDDARSEPTTTTTADAPPATSAATSGSASSSPATEPPAPTSTTATTTTPEGCDAAAAVGGWPLRRRLASLVVVGVDPSDAGEATAVVTEHHVGGVFVGGNDDGLLASGALEDLRAGEPTGLLVTIDEEGGRVQRVDGLDGDVPSAREMAATMTVDEVRALAERRGRVMAEAGVTADLAPVVDVSDQPDGTVIGDRSWSADPFVVAAYARAYAEGLQAAGVRPVLKHFPGHGAATGDSHEGAVSTPSLDQLRRRDLVPYGDLLPALGTTAGVMLGHLDVPGLTDPDVPASISPAAVALLRDDYGFGGVVMTDDLAAMESITDRLTPADAAVAALAAGVDLVLLSGADVGDLLDRMEAAVGGGELAEQHVDEAVARTLGWKGIDPYAVVL